MADSISDVDGDGNSDTNHAKQVPSPHSAVPALIRSVAGNPRSSTYYPHPHHPHYPHHHHHLFTGRILSISILLILIIIMTMRRIMVTSPKVPKVEKNLHLQHEDYDLNDELLLLLLLPLLLPAIMMVVMVATTNHYCHHHHQ